jgi:AcrR family transcriptional regulator
VPRRNELATTKAEETRDRILAAALELFRKRGFEATTMRDVAAEAGVATGAAYYYFRSKHDLVMAFYEQTSRDVAAELPIELAASKSLERRVRRIIELQLERFTPHRRFLTALIQTASDPANPLSPFGDETKVIREQAIDRFRQAIDGASESVPKDLAPLLPTLFWLYQMGVIAFWMYDHSPGQKRTQALLDGTLDLMMKLLRLSRLPLMSALRRSVIRTLQAVGIGET